MNKKALQELIREKRSFLCIGLDSDMEKLPPHLLEKEDPIFEFNKAIIQATAHLAVAYKPNLAFYECHGAKGWESLEKTMQFIRSLETPVFTIADAKRGDIGNSSRLYAQTFLHKDAMDFDSVTVNPFMGHDSVAPFLQYKDKFAVILALTSNWGASDFQMPASAASGNLEKLGIKVQGRRKLYEQVLMRSYDWGDQENIMFVVGATKAEMFGKIRQIIPDHFLLVPGVGAQGGSLEEVARHGMNHQCGLLVNSSRGIIFASQGEDFHLKAQEKAQEVQQKMEFLLAQKGIISN